MLENLTNKLNTSKGVPYIGHSARAEIESGHLRSATWKRKVKWDTGMCEREISPLKKEKEEGPSWNDFYVQWSSNEKWCQFLPNTQEADKKKRKCIKGKGGKYKG